MDKICNYQVGLDIGTNSIGFAVTDLNGKLLKHKGKNMWGVDLFDSGETAEKARLHRSNRRRLDRKKQRIKWTQELMAPIVLKEDPMFFKRLAESYVYKESKIDIGNLFDGKDYTDRTYFSRFPTIFHLRQFLKNSNEQCDIRLIYLAIHNIIKYRGNFLYEGQTISAKNINLEDSIVELLDNMQLQNIAGDMVKEFANVLKNSSLRKSEKKDEINRLWNYEKNDKLYFNNITLAILGYKADFKKIFNINDEEEMKFSLSEEDVDDRLDDYLTLEQLEIYNSLVKVYSGIILFDILSGNNVSSISDAMVVRYNEHHQDLRVLKRLFKSLFPERYNYMFKNINEKVNNYANYISCPGKYSHEEFCKELKKFLLKKNDMSNADEDYNYCLKRIEEGSFLLKPRNNQNGVIPNQLHVEELEQIIDIQSKFYPLLANIKDKLISIATYRIPYYIGPLNNNPLANRQFGWMVRKKEGKINPWNFEEIVDVDTSAEKFIYNMTNKCTYLPEEDVMPKYSLVYQQFELLNELNGIKIDGKRLSIPEKRKIFDQLFTSVSRVTDKKLIQWLKKEKIIFSDNVTVTGMQKEGEFASNLKSFIDFKNIFNTINDSNVKMIEDCILWITLFTDKKILRRKITKAYPSISESQISKICKLNYKGWSRLSKKLLVGLKSKDKYGNFQSIIDVMKSTSNNFMQIINHDELGFRQLIEKENYIDDYEGKISYQLVKELPGSPALKRATWQSLLVMQEISKVMGGLPDNIYVEFVREFGEPKRTSSRYKQLYDKYQQIKNNTDYARIKEELAQYAKNEKALDDRALFLYFSQNGKCMYSGKPLDLRYLYKYQIDHIIPQSYIKDDSLDNLALVIPSENQRKLNSMLLNQTIINSQKKVWLSLLENNLISNKKYSNLCRENFDDNELKGFINRQLVETRQVTKNVVNLFNRIYPQTNVVIVKAGLTSDLRKRYGLYKIRELNDYHHAHDAFLAIRIGHYISRAFPYMKSDMDYGSYRKFASNSINVKKEQYGYFIGRISQTFFINKENAWNGEEYIHYMRKALNYKDCFVSRKTEEMTGEFYNQTIYPASENLLQRKKDMPTSLYGGYKGINQAYYVVIEYDVKSGRGRKLVGVPIYVVKLMDTDTDAINKYFSKLGYKNPKIVKDKIKKYQKINYEGNEWYIVSDSEVINAKQLVMGESYNNILYRLLSGCERDIDINDILKLFDEILNKMVSYYPCFKNIANNIKSNREGFKQLDGIQKGEFIKQVLIVLSAKSSNGNFKKFNFCGLDERVGRLGSKNLDISKIEFIDTSVTGLFERRYRL